VGQVGADIADVGEEARHQQVGARFAGGDSLEGRILDRAQLAMKPPERLVVSGTTLFELDRPPLDAADQGDEPIEPPLAARQHPVPQPAPDEKQAAAGGKLAAVDRALASANQSSPAPFPSTGRMTRTRAPWPSVLSTSIWPP